MTLEAPDILFERGCGVLTVRDILALPVLRDNVLLAGAGGLDGARSMA